jgi:predicted membrane GTPase involved in stress response
MKRSRSGSARRRHRRPRGFRGRVHRRNADRFRIAPSPLPFVPIDPPTIKMQFAVNDGRSPVRKASSSPRATFGTASSAKPAPTSRSASPTPTWPKVFAVSARGEMQIAILVEQMRREGYEVMVSRPEVLWKKGPERRTARTDRETVRGNPRRQVSATSWKISPTARAQIVNMNHVGNHRLRRGARPDARPHRL